jgi:hypothetical protein
MNDKLVARSYGKHRTTKRRAAQTFAAWYGQNAAACLLPSKPNVPPYITALSVSGTP